MNDLVSPVVLLTVTAGLLGFLVGVYTLVGRDRKSPYLINSVFAVFLICLVGAGVDVLALILKPWGWGLQLVGATILFFAIVITCWRLWTIYVRFALFVDPGPRGRLKLLPGLRQWRAWRKRKKGPSYEHDPVHLSKTLLTEISTIMSGTSSDQSGCGTRLEVRDEEDPRSLALALRHQGQANELLSDLAAAFLAQEKHYVQYMTASRHPIEFVQYLKARWDKRDKRADGANLSWNEVRNRIVVVDAYTSHFGFLDTINRAKKDELQKELGNQLLESRETYAGLHSAASAAFKLMKEKSQPPRQPTLVIYEDMYALTDLESVEQYRIFSRHVLPSERLWDGMFTVFTETAQREEDWKLVSSYASMILDLRSAE